jgi:signal peptidase I
MAKNPEKNFQDIRKAGKVFAKEILIPIFMALIVIQFVIQAFKIPSASMEDSLLIGDFLLGLKFIYGAPIPFSHKKLPALTDPKPGDVLIFKYPGDPEYPQGDKDRYKFVANLFLFGNLYWDRQPSNGESHMVWYSPKDFIKRCVAKSGQTLTVSGKKFFVDGKELPLPPHGKFIDFREYDPQRDTLNYHLPSPGDVFDFDTLSLKDAVWIKSVAYQENPDSKVELHLDLWKDSVIDNNYVLPYLNADPKVRSNFAVFALLNYRWEQVMGPGNTPYLHSENIPFSAIQDLARKSFIRTNDLPAFGVQTQPGQKRIEMSEYFMGHYLELIGQNIRGQGVQVEKKYRIKPSLFIDGKKVANYRIQKKCFFMMGDNRDNSSDGRYWGLLSLDNVKAKAFIVYFSFENEDDSFAFTNPISWFTIPAKIRWSRIGKLIE